MKIIFFNGAQRLKEMIYHIYFHSMHLQFLMIYLSYLQKLIYKGPNSLESAMNYNNYLYKLLNLKFRP